MKKLKVIFVLCLGIFIFSCESKSYEEIKPSVTPIVDIYKPTYEKDFKPLLTASCIGCHVTGGQKPYLDSYALAKTATEGKLICKIEGTSCGTMMPKGGKPWSKETVDIIKLWKAQGYLEK
jgi:hypothetical protein